MDKMKAKLPIYTLIKGLGLTPKKIVYCAYNKSNMITTLNLKNHKTEQCLQYLAETLLEKEKNIMRIS